MEQKRVSFKVAKAIKEAGYPQGETWHFYEASGKPNTMYGILRASGCDAPTYLDVWLWLWREKKVELSLCYGARMYDAKETLICFPLDYHHRSHPKMKYIIQAMHDNPVGSCSYGYNHEHADPEEAIIAAIEYLVDNDLIK